MNVELVNSHVLLPDPANWRERPQWARRWQTEIADGLTGAQERGALRQIPRVALTWLVTPLSLQWQSAFEDRLNAALKSGCACAPYFGRGSVLTADAGGTSVTIDAGAWTWQSGDWAIFIDTLASDTAPVYAVKQVTVSGSTLSWTGALGHTFAAGGFVWPLLFGRLTADQLPMDTGERGAMRLTLTELTGSFRAGAGGAPTYLTRPILETPPNWAHGVTRDFRYDLRELSLGFGAEVFEKLQSHVVQGFESTLELNSAARISACDNFTAALRGRLAGFWLPSPKRVFEICAGFSATKFDITAQGFADTFDDHPAQYVRFTKDGQTAKHAKITGVTDNGDGTERVTVDAGVSVDATWTAHRLHYVRLADDEEKAVVMAEGWQQRPLRVIELPAEYAAFETGESPVFLYHFTSGGTHWRFTSFASHITSNGQTFTAKPITHGAITMSIAGGGSETTLEAVNEAGHPLAAGFPNPSPALVNVEILETTYGAPDTVTVRFTGIVSPTPRQGKRISARCVSALDFHGQRFLDALIGPRCALPVYSAPCGVLKVLFQKSAMISVVNGRTLRVTHASELAGLADNWFAFGWIETGGEIRTVLESTAVSSTVQELVLNLPLTVSGVGAAVTCVPGCDGKWATCQDKFDNDNAVLHPFVPLDNPTIAAPQPVASGGKK